MISFQRLDQFKRKYWLHCVNFISDVVKLIMVDTFGGALSCFVYISDGQTHTYPSFVDLELPWGPKHNPTDARRHHSYAQGQGLGCDL